MCLSCGCIPYHPKCAAGFVLRVSFGLATLFVGLAHYMTLPDFVIMVSDGLGPLAPLGNVWAYVYPGLLVVGGALFALGLYANVATLAVGIALGSIAPGMLAKTLITGTSMADMMGAAINAFIWLLVYAWVVKCMGCCGCCGTCDSSGKKK